MATLAELVVKIGADVAGFDSSISGVNSKVRKFGRELESVGRSLTIGVTAPIVGMGAAIVSASGDFEQGMNKVLAIAGPTEEQFISLREQAKELGSATKFSATQAAEGMAFLGMAGFDTNEIIGAMPGLLSLAASGQLELGEAADIASNVLSGFGENAAEASRLSDVFAKAAASSNTSVLQLGEAMSKVAPIAKNVGLSIEETTAIIGRLGDAGIQGEEAGTALRAVIAGLIKPSAEASDTLARLGVSVFDSSGKMRPLIQIMGDIGDASASATDLVTIFGRRATSAASIMAEQGVEGLQGFTDELERSGGAAQKMAETMERGFKGAFTELRSALEGLAISVGDSGLLDFMTDITRAATDAVRELSKLPQPILAFGSAVLGVTALVGPLALVIGKLAIFSTKAFPAVKTLAGALFSLASVKVAGIIAAAAAVGQLVLAFNELESLKDQTQENLKELGRQNLELSNMLRQAAKDGVDLGIVLRDDLGPKIQEGPREYNKRLLELVRTNREALQQWKASKPALNEVKEGFDGVAGSAGAAGGKLNEALKVILDFPEAATELFEVQVKVAESADQVAASITKMLDAMNDKRLDTLGIALDDINSDLVRLGKAAPEVEGALENMQQDAKGAAEAVGNLGVASTETATRGLTQISTAVTDLSRDIADSIIHLNGFKDAFISFGETILRRVIEEAIKPLIDQLTNFLVPAISGAIKKLGELFGITGGVGGGAAGGVAGQVAGSGGGAGGAASSSGVLGAVGVGAAVASAVSGVISNFQLARQENTLNAIEESTRRTNIVIEKELSIHSANLVYITGNTDDIKTHIWTIDDNIKAIREIWNDGVALRLAVQEGVENAAPEVGGSVAAAMKKGPFLTVSDVGPGLADDRSIDTRTLADDVTNTIERFLTPSIRVPFTAPSGRGPSLAEDVFGTEVGPLLGFSGVGARLRSQESADILDDALSPLEERWKQLRDFAEQTQAGAAFGAIGSNFNRIAGEAFISLLGVATEIRESINPAVPDMAAEVIAQTGPISSIDEKLSSLEFVLAELRALNSAVGDLELTSRIDNGDLVFTVTAGQARASAVA